MSHSPTQLQPQKDSIIDVTIRHGCILIHPVPVGLPQTLAIRETTFKGNRPQAGDFELQPFSLDPLGRLRVAPGLLSRAVHWLQKNDYHGNIHDQRMVGDYGREPVTVIDGGSSGNLSHALQEYTHGAFVIAGRTDCTRTIADVCKCLPTAKIGIVTANKYLSRQLCFAIGNLTNESACSKPGTNDWYQARIRVVPACHLNAFHGNEVDVLLIVFNYNAISAASMRDVLSLQPSPQRVYALRQDGKLNPAETVALEAIAGPTVHISPRVRLIEKQHCTSRSFPELGPARDLLSRRKIWKHEARNRWIAEIAAATACEHLETLYEHGLFLRDSDGLPTDPGVTVLVESREHAKELTRYLPQWDVLDLTGGNRVDGPMGRVITLARAAEDLIAADVLIVTGGDSRSLPLPPHQPGQKLHMIILKDGLYETRPANGKTFSAATTETFPVVSSPLPVHSRLQQKQDEETGSNGCLEHLRGETHQKGGEPEPKECAR